MERILTQEDNAMIPPGITAEHVRLALKDLDEGAAEHRFADSTGYDLLFEGRSYPPKAALGLAARHLPGRSVPLTPDDFSGGEDSSCFRVLRRLGFKIVPKQERNHSSPLNPADVNAERAHRLDLWKRLAGSEPVAVRIEPSRLRDLGVYGGAQGIWVDSNRTSPLTASGGGVTVGVLHTGRSYADDLSENGVIYHYPSTRRQPGRDAGEIRATKAAKELGLPIFVISHSKNARHLRDIHLGWVEEWDDADKLFLITFGLEAPTATEPPADSEFSVYGPESGKKTTKTTRPNQQRFRFDVVKRYGVRCAVCQIEVFELLDAAHVVSKQTKGSDDPRNGILLCASHHRAFDACFFGIEPETKAIRYRPEGPSETALGITVKELSPKREQHPHIESLRQAWARWQKDRETV